MPRSIAAVLLCTLAAASPHHGQLPGCDGGDDACAADEVHAADHVMLQHQHARMSTRGGGSEGSPCLCVFDVDRTLTGKQGSASGECPGNVEVPEVWDSAYGQGVLTLSALGAAGLNGTFCGQCYLGVCSAGTAGGENSAERAFLAERVLVSGPQQELFRVEPGAKAWSHGDRVRSPFVLGKADRRKQEAVEDIVRWYEARGIRIAAGSVHFFGDRTENIMPFEASGFNSREISCASRDVSIGSGMVGLCGATPEEIVDTRGLQTCGQQVAPAPAPSSTACPELDNGPGPNGDGGPLRRCQGDCDRDGDCEGALVCFQRDGDTEVPGCVGKGAWDWDYCTAAA